MIAYGWVLAVLTVAVAAATLRRRPGRRTSALIVVGALGIALWNVPSAYYLAGPLPYRVSALYLTGVSLSVTAWLILARRAVHRMWWPSVPLQILFAAQPALLALSALLPESVWSRLFWPAQPWRHEPVGIAFEIHSSWSMVIIAVGAASLVRRAEQTRGLNRYLAAGAVALVSIGTGAQLTGVRVMSTGAFLAFVAMMAIYARLNPSSTHALAEIAELDPVTRVMARSGLDLVLRHAVKVARHRGAPLSVMVIDVDDFKGINDGHGHMVGDIALCHVAAKVRATAGELVGRFGGDEFVVVLPGAEIGRAKTLAAIMVEEVSTPFTVAGSDVTVSVSVGVAQYAGGSVDDLLVAADRAMYAAKRNGGGQARVLVS